MKTISLLKLFILPLILFPLLFGCKKSKETTKNIYCSSKEYTCVNDKQIVEIITNKGAFTIELYGEEAPVTVGNFLYLIKNNVYNESRFNRVIRDPKPFVMQGGFDSKNLGNYRFDNQDFAENKITYSRFIPLEILIDNEEVPRYNQTLDATFFDKINLRHTKWSLSMARSEALDSASSQFFISLRNLPELDGRYAVFGKVIKGFNIIDLIDEGDYIITTKVINN